MIITIPTRFITSFFILVVALPAVAEEKSPPWRGWSRFEVVQLDEGASRVSVATVAGVPTVIVINPRQSRLDLLRIDHAAKKTVTTGNDTTRSINAIPLPMNMVHERIPCPAPPRGIAVVNNDIVVIHGAPWRATRYRHNADTWQAISTRELPDIEPDKRLEILTLTEIDQTRLLIPTATGIQTLNVPNTEGLDQPVWLRPRTRTRGVAWDLVDLDRDGDMDIVEAFPSAGEGLRWQENQNGVLTPPQPLMDDPVKSMAAINGPYPLAIINRHQQSSVDLASLETGTAEPLATGWTIPLSNQGVAVGVSIAGAPMLAVATPGEGRIDLHRLQGATWADGGGFPAPRGMKAMISPLADDILIWVTGQADLLRTQWQDGRLSFPIPWRPDDAVQAKDRLIVGVDSAADIDWWFQREDDDLCLWVWHDAAPTPTMTRFAKAGAKITQAQWLGGDRAVIRMGFQTDAELIIAQGEKPVLRRLAAALPGLARLEPNQIRLVSWEGTLRPARIVDGGWQWLDNDVNTTDQIQLPDDDIADLAIINEKIWALTAKDKGAWHIELGANGLLHPIERLRSVIGDRLRPDHWLGLLAVGVEQVRVLADGAPRLLVVKAQADLRALTPTGSIQASRLSVECVRGTAHDLIVHDDPARRIALFASDGTPIAAWPVWEDRRYPYDDKEEKKSAVSEPRSVASGDLDHDGRPDLVLLSQDRVVFYLSASEIRP